MVHSRTLVYIVMLQNCLSSKLCSLKYSVSLHFYIIITYVLHVQTTVASDSWIIFHGTQYMSRTDIDIKFWHERRDTRDTGYMVAVIRNVNKRPPNPALWTAVNVGCFRNHIWNTLNIRCYRIWNEKSTRINKWFGQYKIDATTLVWCPFILHCIYLVPQPLD